MFGDTLSILVKKPEVKNYAHVRKSLPLASPKELLLSLGIPLLIKIGREMVALSWTQA